jgi:hypothetical protein
MREKSHLISPERSREKGIAALELAFILPVLLVLSLGVIDFGGLIHSRLIVTNVSREGGSLASRETNIGVDFLNMLQTSGNPLDLNGLGKIWISRITAGWRDTKGVIYDPSITLQISNGSLVVPSAIHSGGTMGLSPDLYGHLVYKPDNSTSDIDGVTVVEVYYKYIPITPLPKIIENILLTDGDGTIIGSKAVFEGVE